jgi:erythromycin esterase
MWIRARCVLQRVALPLLALAAHGGCSPPTGPDGEGARLLTDDELRAPAPPVDVVVPHEWSEWVQAHHVPIRSLVASADFSDLAPLAGFVGNRRVVQLGESSHGVAEFNHLKVRLVKYLHEELGFDVVALESSFYECFMVNQQVAALHAGDLMWRCAFPSWRTVEVLQLFEYVKATRATSRPLHVTGFDSQMTASMGVPSRPAFLHDAVTTFNPAYADSVARLDSAFLASDLATASETFTAAYEALVDSLDARRTEILASFPGEPWRALVARQAAWSMLRVMEQSATHQASPPAGGLAAAIQVREDAMAYNLDVIVDSLFPGKKVVVWGHNYHISRGIADSDNSGEPPGVLPMGYTFDRQHAGEVYSIGTFMLRGRAVTTAGIAYDIEEPTTVGLEQVLNAARRKHVFVDVASSTPSAATSWMFEEVVGRSWGYFDVRLVPRDHYHGLVLVHTVTPPRMWP